MQEITVDMVMIMWCFFVLCQATIIYLLSSINRTLKEKRAERKQGG